MVLHNLGELERATEQDLSEQRILVGRYATGVGVASVVMSALISAIMVAYSTTIGYAWGVLLATAMSISGIVIFRGALTVIFTTPNVLVRACSRIVAVCAAIFLLSAWFLMFQRAVAVPSLYGIAIALTSLEITLWVLGGASLAIGGTYSKLPKLRRRLLILEGEIFETRSRIQFLRERLMSIRAEFGETIGKSSAEPAAPASPL